jgi:DUF971 family protein
MITPTSIELERSSHLSVTFEDGSDITIRLGDLRAACPCADCRGLRERDVRPGTAAPVAIDAELHGSYGLTIFWDDGHRTGIYSWEYLRHMGGGR